MSNRTPITELKPGFPEAREAAYEHVAEAVSHALVRASKRLKKPAGPKLLGELMGRTMTRLYYVLQSGSQDTSVSTLSDLAYATGHRLVITMEPIEQ